jgi:hypothetical protein
MSTLVTQTISNGTVSTSSANVIQGSAKVWVNFNGTGTVAIRASYNVSSITDNGTGDYTINFTNALPDANYVWTVGGWNNGVGNGGWIAAGTGTGSYPAGISTTALRLVCFNNSGTAQDQDAVCVSIYD